MSRRKNESQEDYRARCHAQYLARKESGYLQKYWADRANRRRRNAYQRERYAADPDRARAYRTKDREYHADVQRRWRLSNPDAVRAIERRYRQTHAREAAVRRLRRRYEGPALAVALQLWELRRTLRGVERDDAPVFCVGDSSE